MKPMCRTVVVTGCIVAGLAMPSIAGAGGMRHPQSLSKVAVFKVHVNRRACGATRYRHGQEQAWAKVSARGLKPGKHYGVEAVPKKKRYSGYRFGGSFKADGHAVHGVGFEMLGLSFGGPAPPLHQHYAMTVMVYAKSGVTAATDTAILPACKGSWK